MSDDKTPIWEWKWVPSRVYGKDYTCSKCKETSPEPYTFCPHCGVKIDGYVFNKETGKIEKADIKRRK